MNKSDTIERLDAIEAEARELREIIEAPEQREPEAGDVFVRVSGEALIRTTEGELVSLSGERAGRWGPGSNRNRNAARIFSGTYLGKFDEVYVKVADVREALSHEGDDGDSILKSSPLKYNPYGITTSREALRKLNITND